IAQPQRKTDRNQYAPRHPDGIGPLGPLGPVEAEDCDPIASADAPRDQRARARWCLLHQIVASHPVHAVVEVEDERATTAQPGGLRRGFARSALMFSAGVTRPNPATSFSAAYAIHGEAPAERAHNSRSSPCVRSRNHSIPATPTNCQSSRSLQPTRAAIESNR